MEAVTFLSNVSVTRAGMVYSAANVSVFVLTVRTESSNFVLAFDSSYLSN